MPQDNKLVASDPDDPATSDESLLETALRRYGDWWAGGGVSKMLGMTPPTAAEYAQGFGTDALGGMIAGERSLTANKAALAIAKNMAKRGKDKDSIFARTGWWQGSDDEWRYEIHDPPAEKSYMLPMKETLPANQLLQHPDLWKAYPSLGNTRVEIGGSLPEGYGGDYIPGRLRLSPDYAYKTDLGHSITSHELQHGIQAIENFAPGGDPAAWEAAGATPTEAEEIYNRTAGEVEARNVQKRASMTPLQRRITPPYSTEDVPKEQQLIFDTNGQLRSLEPVEGNPFQEKEP